MTKRRHSRQIRVGRVKIGGDSPVSIQSMTNTVTSDVRKTVAQIKRLETAGCEIIRVAVKTLDDAYAIRAIKRGIKIPLVADIHFDHRLALASIRSGADKIRINPGNMKRTDDVIAVVREAKSAGIPIRIGVNSGSLSSDPVKAVLKYIKLFESEKFRDIIISLKSSDVAATVAAYRKVAEACDHPLHLGVTATGPYDTGIVKSSVGIGSLLLDGIGDTVRVSLTADPAYEVRAARKILSACGARNFGPNIISCPTCGRCQVDLIAIVNELEKKLSTSRPVSIAVMGCEVNGPGEAKEADIGIAFGKNSGVLFRKGKVVKTVKAKNAIKEILKSI